MECVEVAPCIWLIDNAIDGCEEIIKLCSSKEFSWRSATVGTSGSFSENNKIRNNEILDLAIDETHHEVLKKSFDNIWNYADLYGKEKNIAFSFMEDMQVLHYKDSHNFYKSHADDGPHTNRVFSALVYLNDVSKGGETYFNNFDLAITPSEGRLVLFPSNYAYSHEARPPVSGEKYVMSTWFEKVTIQIN